MIKLDKWDSQLVWLSKGWVESEFKKRKINFDLEIVLKTLWSKRSGVEIKEINHIACYLVELVKEIYSEFPVKKFLDDLRPVNLIGNVFYTDNKGYILRICKILLWNYLSTV